MVAGGVTELFGGDDLPTVEVLNIDTLQWYTASSLPQAAGSPQITLCGGSFYLCIDNTIFSCLVEDLLKSCKPTSTNSSDGSSVWTRLAHIPRLNDSSLATLRGRVLAIGGYDKLGNPSGAILCYEVATNSWSAIGELPTPRYLVLAAVLPSNELVVVGGHDKNSRSLYTCTNQVCLVT